MLDITRNVYKAIQQYWRVYEFSPSIKDIMDITEINSSSHVLVHLKKLESEGWITRVPKISRSIVVVTRYDTTHSSVTTTVNLE